MTDNKFELSNLKDLPFSINDNLLECLQLISRVDSFTNLQTGSAWLSALTKPTDGIARSDPVHSSANLSHVGSGWKAHKTESHLAPTAHTTSHNKSHMIITQTDDWQ